MCRWNWAQSSATDSIGVRAGSLKPRHTHFFLLGVCGARADLRAPCAEAWVRGVQRVVPWLARERAVIDFDTIVR